MLALPCSVWGGREGRQVGVGDGGGVVKDVE